MVLNCHILYRSDRNKSTRNLPMVGPGLYRALSYLIALFAESAVTYNIVF